MYYVIYFRGRFLIPLFFLFLSVLVVDNKHLDIFIIVCWLLYVISVTICHSLDQAMFENENYDSGFYHDLAPVISKCVI